MIWYYTDNMQIGKVPVENLRGDFSKSSQVFPEAKDEPEKKKIIEHIWLYLQWLIYAD